jgi:hypothetical protein
VFIRNSRQNKVAEVRFWVFLCQIENTFILSFYLYLFWNQNGLYDECMDKTHFWIKYDTFIS